MTASDQATAPGRAGLRVALLLALLVVVTIGPIVHEYKAQQASRQVLTAAIWDDGTIKVDRYAAADPPVLGVDRAVRGDHTYSDKAPLQPLLAVPFYAAYRAVGGEPAIEQRLHKNLGLWWTTFWMATIPGALLAALMYLYGRRISPVDSLAGSAALFFGSLLLPFSALLFGHVLAALLLFAAFVAIAVPRPSAWWLAAAGALVGAAVATEYTAGLSVFVLGGYAVWRARWNVVWFVAGGIPAALGLAWYHNVAFGSPLAHPYRYSAFSEVTEEARGFFEIFSRIHLDHLALVFVDGRGFLFATPMVVLGLVGLVILIRTDRRFVAPAATALAMFLAFLVIPVFWGNPWGGDAPGARYMTPALPFLVIGATAIWTRSRIWGRAAAAIGITTMAIATLTDPLLSDEARVSIGSWIRLAVDGDIVPTVFTIALGPFGWIVHGLLVAAVVRLLVRAHRTDQSERSVTAAV